MIDAAFRSWPALSLGEIQAQGVSFRLRSARYRPGVTRLYLIECGLDPAGLPYERPLVLYRTRTL